MYVKIMSAEKLPDEDPKKCYNIYSDIDIMNLSRDEDNTVVVELVNGSIVTTVKPYGNVYCLGDMGMQIAFFALKEDELYYDSGEAGIQ
jgi:hypothetical protein